MSTSRNVPTPRPGSSGLENIPRKSLEERIAEQGVSQTASYERLFGSGAELWSDDAEFEAFLDHLQAIRCRLATPQRL